MQPLFARFVAAATLLSGTAFSLPGVAQEPTGAPTLTLESINGADVDGWLQRRKAIADAKASGLAEAQAVMQEPVTGQPQAGSVAAPAAPADGAAPAADATPPAAGDAAAPPAAEAPAAADGGAPATGETGESQAAAEVPAPEDLPDPFLLRLQVLLDRAHASPGVIDGLDGENTRKAIRAFAEMHDLKPRDEPDADFWKAVAADAGPVVSRYTITPEDIAGRFVPDLPKDYGELAKLDWLGYRDVVEMLAERFHMDEDLLRHLNPGADFKTAGQQVLVAVPGEPAETKVARIVVDKGRGELLAYDADGKLVLIDPATIGSEGTPSPSGTMKVNGSSPDPTYAYNPEKNFKQGDNDKKLTLPAGPNGPVGSMWIDLSKPTYGIHGTPEPSKIDKTASHGCVRLTNWDAQALAKLVQPARTVVEFKE